MAKNCFTAPSIKEKTNASLDQVDLDPSYADRIKNRTSRAKKLLKKRSSLRVAFLLKEIIQRPYDL